MVRITLSLIIGLSSILAQARIIDGYPVNRGGGLISKVACSFACPLGLSQLNSISFYYENYTRSEPRGWVETKYDGGVYFCFGERRTVGNATIPSLPLSPIEVTQCRVNITTFVDGDEVLGSRSCNEPRLETCLDYEGGDACYEKWCR